MLKDFEIKKICELYQDGCRVVDIAEALNHGRDAVYRALKKNYFLVTGQEFLLSKDSKKIKYAELKKKFDNYYIPFKQSRKVLCKLLGCSVFDFEQMCKAYKINHLRLKTYGHQKTLCNVPEEVFNSVKAYANKHGRSVREVVCCALNEFMLKENCDE